MNEMKAITELTLFRTHSKRLQDFLLTAVKQFQSGEDSKGLKSLLSAAKELENTVEIDQNSQTPQVNLSQLLPVLRKLHFYMQNKDIPGTADLLEDALYPLTEEWLKGCDGT